MRWSGALVLALASFLPNALAVGILAIDYGTGPVPPFSLSVALKQSSSWGRRAEWTKLSLVKPGTPFDVLLNRDSKRKIQSVVSIRGEDRLFGGDAAAVVRLLPRHLSRCRRAEIGASQAARFPQNSYPGAKLLLGEAPSSPSASQHSSLFSIPLSTTPRSSISLQPALPPPSNASYLPEDLLAMQFQYFRELAESQASEKVVDAIVTVPTWFTQPQRNAILDAMSLAGLRNLGLVEDGATVGVNYAMTRAFSTDPEHHVVYDAGAGGIRATVVAFTMEEQKVNPKSKMLKNVTTVEVKGTGWDRTVGGWTFDGRIRDLLKQDFEAKTGVKLDGNGRALAKLLREAARVKQVLSANQESQSRVRRAPAHPTSAMPMGKDGTDRELGRRRRLQVVRLEATVRRRLFRRRAQVLPTHRRRPRKGRPDAREPAPCV